MAGFGGSYGNDPLFRRRIQDETTSALRRRNSKVTGLASAQGGGQYTLKPTEMSVGTQPTAQESQAFNQRFKDRMEYGDRWNRRDSSFRGLGERRLQNALEVQRTADTGALNRQKVVSDVEREKAGLMYGPGDPAAGVPEGTQRIGARAAMINAERGSQQSPIIRNIPIVMTDDYGEKNVPYPHRLGPDGKWYPIEASQIPTATKKKKGQMTGTGTSDDPYHYSNY